MKLNKKIFLLVPFISLLITLYFKNSNQEILLIDVYRLSNTIIISSIFNSSNPSKYTTYITDPMAQNPYITEEPINKPVLVDSETVRIFGKEIKVPLYEPAGVQKCLTPLFNINSCQQICISTATGVAMSIFNLFSLVYNTPENYLQLNISNSENLKINGKTLIYGLTNCSTTTLNTVFWGFLIFASIFSILVFGLFAFEIVEYLRFKADMKDPLIIGGEIRTITSKDFSSESISTL